MMRIVLLIVMAVVALSACRREEVLEFAVTPKLRDHAIADGLVDLARQNPYLAITAREVAPSGVSLLQLIADGDADLALVENSMPYMEGVTTILPLYSALLHILYRKDLPVDSQDPGDLFRGRTVYTPGPGSMPHELLLTVGQHLKIDWSETRFTTDNEPRPDIAVIFAAPSAAQLAEYLEDYRLLSLGDPVRAGRGSVADGITFRYPQMRVVIVPEHTYGDLTPAPAVTLGVDMLLVGRATLSSEAVYDLVQLVVENKQQLAQSFPAVFRGAKESFDSSALNFPLHPGARDYLERDAPSFVQRYVDVWGFVLSLSIALVSGLLGLQRWRVHRRKNRIDDFYEKLLALRATTHSADWATRQRTIAVVNELEAEGFRQLIDERLAADESFRIFITLAHDVRRELARGAYGEVTRMPGGKGSSGLFGEAASEELELEFVD